MYKGARQQEKTTYTPSQRQNEEQMSALGFLDIYIYEKRVFIVVFYLVLACPRPYLGLEEG